MMSLMSKIKRSVLATRLPQFIHVDPQVLLPVVGKSSNGTSGREKDAEYLEKLAEDLQHKAGKADQKTHHLKQVLVTV